MFKDLVPFIELGPNNFTYAPQQAFGVARTISRPAGERVVLEFPEVSHPDNRYQWVKNGSNVTGATSRTFTISSMSDSDQGTYSLRVTNPKAPDLTLTSVDIELVLGDGSSDTSDTNEPQQPDTPTLLNPSDNSTNLSISPAFEWSDVAADNYLFQIDKLNSIVRVADESTTGTSLTLPEDLDYFSDYRWRVKAVKDGVERMELLQGAGGTTLCTRCNGVLIMNSVPVMNLYPFPGNRYCCHRNLAQHRCEAAAPP